MNALTLRHAHTVPAILANAGENAATKFLEFFAARIRNLNTREAYARACAQFLAWSGQHLDDIRLITPMHVAAYIEKHPGSPQTIKQHLAAIKMLFDYLVISQREPDSPLFPAASMLALHLIQNCMVYMGSTIIGTKTYAKGRQPKRVLLGHWDREEAGDRLSRSNRSL